MMSGENKKMVFVVHCFSYPWPKLRRFLIWERERFENLIVCKI